MGVSCRPSAVSFFIPSPLLTEQFHQAVRFTTSAEKTRKNRRLSPCYRTFLAVRVYGGSPHLTPPRWCVSISLLGITRLEGFECLANLLIEGSLDQIDTPFHLNLPQDQHKTWLPRSHNVSGQAKRGFFIFWKTDNDQNSSSTTLHQFYQAPLEPSSQG